MDPISTVLNGTEVWDEQEELAMMDSLLVEMEWRTTTLAGGSQALIPNNVGSGRGLAEKGTRCERTTEI